MNSNSITKYARITLYVAGSTLAVFLLISYFKSDLFSGGFESEFNYNKGATFATIIAGTTGVILSFGGMLLYFSAIKQNTEFQRQNNFQNTITNHLSNLHAIIQNIQYKGKSGISAIEEAYEEIKIISNRKISGRKLKFANNSENRNYLQKINRIVTQKKNQVFIQFVLSVRYLLLYINELQDNDDKIIYYKLLKSNINPVCYPILLYYFHFEINNLRGDSSQTEINCLKIILSKRESNLFEFIDKNDLININHLESFYIDLEN